MAKLRAHKRNGSPRGDLPEGWALPRLADIATDIQPGFACGRHADSASGVAQLRPMNVTRAGKIDLQTLVYVKTEVSRDERWLRQGDIVFNNTNSAELVGKTAYYNLPERRAFSNHMTRVRCDARVADQRFCALALHEKWLERHFESICNNHVSQASVGRKALLETFVPLPPLAEQRRIVAKIDALIARVDAVRERLAKVTVILKRFRQSVLAAACSGHLTTDWRDHHPNIFAAAGRIAELLRKREALWKSRESGSAMARRTKYKPPLDSSPPVDAAVPDKWTWMSVSSVAVLDVGFAFKSTDFAEDGIRLLRGENVEPGRLRWKDVRYWSSERVKPFERLLIEPGEIILALDRPVVSSGLKIARAVRSDVPCLLVQRVMRFKMVDLSDTDYLYICLRDRRFVDFLAHEGMTGSDLPHITGTGVAEFTIPFPPEAERDEIGRRVEALFKLADTIDKCVAMATARADKLTQSILARAFRGELVPTEAELGRQEGRPYEPATALLARIAVERPQKNGPKRANQTWPRSREMRPVPALGGSDD